MTTRLKKFAAPEVRTLATFGRGPLPKGPVIVHLEKREWEKIDRKLEFSRKPPRKGAKGLLVSRDPFGNFQVVPICVSGSKEGLACIPEIVRGPGGGFTFSGGCRCIGGKDPVDPPTPSGTPPMGTCSLTIGTSGFTCTGNCGHTVPFRRCQLVKTPFAGHHAFVTCECK